MTNLSPRWRYGLLEVRGTVIHVQNSRRPGRTQPNPWNTVRLLLGLILLAALVVAGLWVYHHFNQLTVLAALVGLWALGLHFLLRALGLNFGRMLAGLLGLLGSVLGGLLGLFSGSSQGSVPTYREGGVVQVLLVQDTHGRQHTLYLPMPPHRFYALPGHELRGWGSRWRGGTQLIGAHNLTTGQSVGL